jgi:hypothetical protein
MKTLKVFLAVLLAVPAWTCFPQAVRGQERAVSVEGKGGASICRRQRVRRQAAGNTRLFCCTSNSPKVIAIEKGSLICSCV